MEIIKVSFDALIWEIKTKSLRSGDKATRIVLEFDSNEMTEVLNKLNELQRADEVVSIGIAGKKK